MVNEEDKEEATLASRLMDAGVELVFKANYNSNAWNMAIPQVSSSPNEVDEGTFMRIAKKAGFAFHHDKVDMRINNEKIDFEAYYTSIGTYSVRHVVKGE